MRSSDPEGRYTALPKTVLTLPKCFWNNFESPSRSTPRTSSPPSSRSPNHQLLWRTMSSFPTTRICRGGGRHLRAQEPSIFDHGNVERNRNRDIRVGKCRRKAQPFHVAPEKLLPVGQVLQQRLIVELTGSFLPTDDRAKSADQWKGAIFRARCSRPQCLLVKEFRHGITHRWRSQVKNGTPIPFAESDRSDLKGPLQPAQQWRLRMRWRLQSPSGRTDGRAVSSSFRNSAQLMANRTFAPKPLSGSSAISRST